MAAVGGSLHLPTIQVNMTCPLFRWRVLNKQHTLLGGIVDIDNCVILFCCIQSQPVFRVLIVFVGILEQ